MGINSNQATGIMLGAIVVGLWLGLTLFATSFGTVFGLWGILGIAMGGSLYGLRIANDMLRILVWILLGISLGMLIIGSIVQEEPRVLATLMTFFGTGLVATSLPLPPGYEPRTGWRIAEDEPTS
jgi:hypothetical protein